MSENKKYTMLSGIPRADVVLPIQVLDQLHSAQIEEERSLERIEILQKALSKSKVVARDELKAILYKYPEVAQDPVYVAALRNLHIDVAAVERDRFKRSSKGSSSNKKQKTGDKKALSDKASDDGKLSKALSDSGSANKATTKEMNQNESKKPAKSEPKSLSEAASGSIEAVVTTKECDSESKEPKTRDTGNEAVTTATPAGEAVKSKEE